MSEQTKITSTSAGTPAQVGLAMLLSLVWVLLWYWSTAQEMVGIWWRSDTYAHGLVVLPICAWLVWRARERMPGLPLKPVWWMSLPILGGGVLWLLGGLASVAAAKHFALVLMLASLLVGVLGLRLAGVLFFPIFFLFFAVPIGDFMVPALMHYTAEFTVWALRLSGVPVYQEGLHFVVPNGRWSIVEACSGSRYLIASLMVGALYAYLNYRSSRRRLWFMVVAAIVPIIANWLRAYMIVMLGYLSDNKLAVGVDHLLYGWVFFGVVIFLMFWIGGRWQEHSPPIAAAPVTANPRYGWSGWGVSLMLALTLLPFPFILRVLDMPVASFPVRLEMPAPTAGWTSGDEQAIAYRPHYAGARATAYRSYLAPGQPEVGLYLAWYYGQREGSEMLSWGNGVIADLDLGYHFLGRQTVSSKSGLTVVESRLSSRQGTLLAWTAYRSDNRNLYRDSEMKIRLALERLLGHQDESAAIVVMTPADDQLATARARLEDFLAAHLTGIEQAIDAAAKSIP